MRVSAGWVLFAVLVLGWVGPARAGFTYESPLCVSPLDVGNYYSDASSEFIGAAKCETLCKKAFTDCREQVARSRACLKATVADNLFYSKNLVCEEIADAATRRQCKMDYNASAAMSAADVNGQASAARSFCGQVRDTCLTDCTAK